MPNINEPLTKQDLVEVLDRLKAIEDMMFTKKEFNDAVETIFKPSFDDVYGQLDEIHRKLDEHDHHFERLEEGFTRMRSLMVTKPYLDDKLSSMEGRWAQRFRSLISIQKRPW